MFVPSAEVMLMGAVVALYLFDSMVLLYCNEAVMYPVGQEGWKLSFGSRRFQWRGREVFLPNPLKPHRPLYRVVWSYGAPSHEGASPHWHRSYRGLGIAIWSMALSLGLLLPLGLFSRWGDVMIVAALIVFYGAALVALGMLWRRRKALRLGRNPFLRLAFECLTCPPFALNLIRHVSLLTQPAELLPAASGLQDVKAWEETRQLLVARLQEELQWLGPSDPETKTVEAELERLALFQHPDGDSAHDRKGSR